MMENNAVKNIIMFFVFLGLIIVGQKTVSVANLGMEFIGLAGLLVLLYLYNRKYK